MTPIRGIIVLMSRVDGNLLPMGDALRARAVLRGKVFCISSHANRLRASVLLPIRCPARPTRASPVKIKTRQACSASAIESRPTDAVEPDCQCITRPEDRAASRGCQLGARNHPPAPPPVDRKQGVGTWHMNPLADSFGGGFDPRNRSVGPAVWSGPHQTGQSAWVEDLAAMNSRGDRKRNPLCGCEVL